MTARDFRHPDQRITHQTAYTLGHKQVRVDTGFNAAGTDNFGANLDLGVGFGRHAQIESNLAQAALGMPNIRGKYNFLDHPRVALSAEVGFAFTNPDMLWAVPDEKLEDAGDVDLYMIPMVLRGTFPVVDWLDLSLSTGYSHVAVGGIVEDEVTAYDGAFGLRSVYIQPAATFYVAAKLGFFVGASFSPYTVVLGDLLVTETVAPGVEGGLETVDWQPVPFSETWAAHAGVELRFGRRTHLQLFVAHNTLSRAIAVSPILPGFNFYWRLP